MKIHTVLITYNRLPLTKQAFASYLETVTVPFQLTIVDNASTDGTQDWINSLDTHVNKHLLNENLYPGRAANLAWKYTWSDVTHLHRADNDFIFLPGWCDEVERMFELQGRLKNRRQLGQLGLRTEEEETSKVNVGGNCVIARELWNKGLRYDERPWPQLRDEIGNGWTEDSLMSGAVRNKGYRWMRVENPCIRPISSDDPTDPYYQGTWEDRGML